MGGPQAAGVLATVRRENIEAEGKTWSAGGGGRLQAAGARATSSARGTPTTPPPASGTTASSRPRETRRVVALSLSAALNAPIPDMRFGVFRM